MAFQQRLLNGVARSFALTIRQLPDDFALPVANGYLLCRIADTIEDAGGLDPATRHALARQFIAVVEHGRSAADFAEAFYPRLSAGCSPAEKALVRDCPDVLAVTRRLPPRHQAALARCVRIMASGMAYYQTRSGPGGLADMPAFNNYCYHVAGVVGEMLTELYCDINAVDDRTRVQLSALAASFGQGLQMVNVLKDLPEDARRGICWLPRDVFETAGVRLETLDRAAEDQAFINALGHMLAIAHGHLRNALEYTLLIPPEQAGYRKFCLWATGMGLLTLRRIWRRPLDYTPADAKIRKPQLLAVIGLVRLAGRRERALRKLFNAAAGDLPASVPVGVNTEHRAIARWFENA
jgi:farnesyl-diphosphate farnesyltransferase